MKPGFSEQAKTIMNERFGRDREIALATVWGDRPEVRTVNGYYEDGAFYVITHAKSNKIRQIASNPHVRSRESGSPLMERRSCWGRSAGRRTPARRRNSGMCLQPG